MIKRKRENPLIKFLFGKEEKKSVETREAGIQKESEQKQIQAEPEPRPERTISRKGTHPLPFVGKESGTENKEPLPVEDTESLEISDEQISAEATEAIEQFISEYPEQSVEEETLTAGEDSDIVEEAVIADIEQALNEAEIDLEFLADAGASEASPSGKGPLFDAIDFEAKVHEETQPEADTAKITAPAITSNFFVAGTASELSRMILTKDEPVTFSESPAISTPDRELAAIDLLSEPEAVSTASDISEELSWEFDTSDFEVSETSDISTEMDPEEHSFDIEDLQDIVLAESPVEEDLEEDLNLQEELIDIEVGLTDQEEEASEETEPSITIDFSPFEEELASEISYPVLEKPVNLRTEEKEASVESEILDTKEAVEASYSELKKEEPEAEGLEERESAEFIFPDLDNEVTAEADAAMDRDAREISSEFETETALSAEILEEQEAIEINYPDLENKISPEVKSVPENETTEAETFTLTEEPSEDLTFDAPALLDDVAFASDVDDTAAEEIEEKRFTALEAEVVSEDSAAEANVENAPENKEQAGREESGEQDIFDFLQSLKIKGEAASDEEATADEISVTPRSEEIQSATNLPAEENYTSVTEGSDHISDSDTTATVKEPEDLSGESDSGVSVDELLQLLGQSEPEEEVFSFPASEGNLSDLEDLSERAAQLRDDSADGSTLDLGSAIFNNEQEPASSSEPKEEKVPSGLEEQTETEALSARSPKGVYALFESPETSDLEAADRLESEEEVETEDFDQIEDDSSDRGEFHFDSYRDVRVKGEYSASSIIPGEAVVGEGSAGSLSETGFDKGTDYYEDEEEAEAEPFSESSESVEKQITGSGLASLIETEIVEELPSLPEEQDLQEKDYQEIRSLFDDAHAAIDQEQEDSDFSFGFEQLQSVEEPEQVRLLFELAYDGIVAPEAIDEYVDEVETAPKELEARDLSKTLEQTRKDLSAPRLTLKGSSIARAKKPSEIYGTEPRLRRIKQPGIFRRLGATLIDFIGTGIFAAALTVITLYLIDPVFTSALVSGSELRTVHLYLIAEVAVLCFLLSLILYPLFFYLKYRKTPGNMMAGTVLVSRDNNELTFYQIALRALLYPLSLLCFGYLPLITGRGSLHDWGSFTALTRSRRQK